MLIPKSGEGLEGGGSFAKKCEIATLKSERVRYVKACLVGIGLICFRGTPSGPGHRPVEF